MRIGLLLPTPLASQASLKDRIFSPIIPAVDLANGLVDKGHDVFFYGPSDVPTKATVIGGNTAYIERNLSYYQFRDREDVVKQSTTNEVKKRDFENGITMQAYKDAREGKLDIIHSYHDFAAHYFDELTKFPTLYTLHNPLPPSEDTIEYERFKTFAHHNYVSISNAQRKSILSLTFVATVYHGISLALSPFSKDGGEELVFMGRLIPDKGAHTALQVAKELDIPLVIATSSNAANRNEEYAQQIAPFLDEKRVITDGMVNIQGKSAFWGKGKAFLFPLQWEEPFGLVMVEAMAVGTPVIAFARGSAPEIIKDGETGFLVNSSDEDIRGDYVIKKTGIAGLKEAVQRLYSLSSDEYKQMRQNARKHVEDKFSVGKMIDAYEALYKKILSS